MTYIGSYKDIPYINASLIIEFNHNKYNQTNLAYDGEWKWSVNNRGFSECIFTYLENFTCYTCDKSNITIMKMPFVISLSPLFLILKNKLKY